MTYRELSAQALAEKDYKAFLEELYRSLTDGRKDPNEVVRDTLFEIYSTASGQGRSPTEMDNLSLPAKVVLHSLDPRNITTEPEYYADIDAKLYAERKPFIWLWQMFDRSPLGQNALLSHRFRRMLAPLIFRRVGENFKCWHFVEWSFGYNLSFGDNVVVHRHVLLDDRGGIEIGKQRDAFRAFMIARHLRPSEWARAAGVPSGEILGFLTGKTRSIAPQTLEKLAKAVNCTPQEFFR